MTVHILCSHPSRPALSYWPEETGRLGAPAPLCPRLSAGQPARPRTVDTLPLDGGLTALPFPYFEGLAPLLSHCLAWAAPSPSARLPLPAWPHEPGLGLQQPVWAMAGGWRPARVLRLFSSWVVPPSGPGKGPRALSILGSPSLAELILRDRVETRVWHPLVILTDHVPVSEDSGLLLLRQVAGDRHMGDPMPWHQEHVLWGRGTGQRERPRHLGAPEKEQCFLTLTAVCPLTSEMLRCGGESRLRTGWSAPPSVSLAGGSMAGKHTAPSPLLLQPGQDCVIFLP